jgi:hypothetical protein
VLLPIIWQIANFFARQKRDVRKRELFGEDAEVRDETVRLCGTVRDSEFAYPYLEGRSVHSKKCRGTMGAGDNPITLLEGLEDLLTFGFLQDMLQCAVCGIRSSGFFFRMTALGKFQISHLDAQGRTRRDNDGALDHILKFPYVSRPMIAAQGIHRR